MKVGKESEKYGGTKRRRRADEDSFALHSFLFPLPLILALSRIVAEAARRIYIPRLTVDRGSPVSHV